MMAKVPPGRAGTVRTTLWIAVATALLFSVGEGAASVGAVIWGLLSVPPVVAERSHTRYDPELGWASVPEVLLEDFYGPGASVQTNRQGFRGREDAPAAIPAGRVRAICLGDSFTFGYGVDDTRTWCARLMALDRRIETVNMGQGGYGLDQAYLWYRRDGAAIAHDIVILAVIRVDFDRMATDSFLGYGKPMLVIRNGELAVVNVPVRRRSDAEIRVRRSLGRLNGLRLLQLTRGFIAWFGGTADPHLDREVEPIVGATLDELRRMTASAGRTLVVVYLPMLDDLLGDDSNRWRAFLGEQAARAGFGYIDLVERLRSLPVGEASGFFIPEGALDFASAEGHYTNEGNAWTAAEIHRELVTRSTTAARLRAVSGSSRGVP